MFSMSLPVFISESVNLEALIPFFLRPAFSFFISTLVNEFSNLSSINSYNLESSTVQPSTLGCISNSLITLKTSASGTISLSFKVKFFTSP